MGIAVQSDQPDVENGDDPLARAGDSRLWLACDDRQRVQIAQNFASDRPEEIRDAILESQDAGASRNLGRMLWQRWIRYRGKALTQLHQNGLLQTR